MSRMAGAATFLSDGWIDRVNEVLASVGDAARRTPRNRALEDLQASPQTASRLRQGGPDERQALLADLRLGEEVSLAGRRIEIVVQRRLGDDRLMLIFDELGVTLSRSDLRQPDLRVTLPEDVARYVLREATRDEAFVLFQTAIIRVEGRTEQLDVLIRLLFGDDPSEQTNRLAAVTA